MMSKNPSNLYPALLALAFALLAGGAVVAQGDPSYSLMVVPEPAENPITPEKVILGKILFWEEQVSSMNNVSCGTCHQGAAGGSDPRSADFAVSSHPGFDGMLSTSDDVRGSQGVRRALLGGEFVDDGTFFPNLQVTGRKTPPFTDAMFFSNIFWDGRATSEFTDPQTGMVSIASGGALESQSVGPPLSDVEMAHQSRNWTEIVVRLAAVKPLRLASNIPADMLAALALNPTYPDLFNAAFGDPAVTSEGFAFAIASYERTLKSDQAPWDLFNDGTDPNALTPAQINGLNVFKTTGRCDLCHELPLFSDDLFHAIGAADPNHDSGLMQTTGLATDKGSFKTPSLRNVGLREAGGIFHHASNNGNSIDQVVAFYNNGGLFNENLDPLIQSLNLTTQERLDLVDFVRNGLTDPRVANETFPFDRPTLYSERQGDGTQVTSNPRTIGIGFADSDGNVPQMIAQQPPSLQTPFFTMGVSNALGGVPAFLAAGFPSAGELLLGQIPLVVSTQPPPFVTPVTLGGTLLGPAEGFGSATISIANNPGIVGFTVFLQWFVADDGGIGVSSSAGVQMTILP